MGSDGHRRFGDGCDDRLPGAGAPDPDISGACFEIEETRQDVFRDLVESSPDLVLCTDPRGRVLYANETARTVLGYSTEAMASMRMEQLLVEDSFEQFRGLADDLIHGETVGPVELNLVDVHRQYLTVEAKLNCRFEHGQPVWFRLVLRDLRSDWAEFAESDVVEESAPQPLILVVEDDDISARMLARLLERGGYRTERASTGSEALEKLKGGQFDAMTLDLALPDTDGVELLHEIRSGEETGDLPVIVVSASADEARQSLTGDTANVADWLNKPFAYDSLRNALTRAVDVGEGRLPRVLHVEDDDEFCEHVRQTLADIADVERASTLSEARKKLKENEDYDLVLLDLTLPDGLGAELLPFLNRPRGRPVPVILVSSSEATDALAAHVADTLVKSHTNQQQILDTIRAHLRR